MRPRPAYLPRPLTTGCRNMAPLKHKHPKEIYKELKKLGFKRTHRGRSENDCHQYELSEGKLTLDVQLWADGMYRVSNSWMGCTRVHPTGFQTVEQLRQAVATQRELSAINKAAYDRE